MSHIISLPTEQAPGKPKPPARCKGCGRAWLAPHACQTPATPPTTPTHWHRPGVTELYTTKPNEAGQWVTELHYRCGCVRLSCTRSEAAMLEERGNAAESFCSTCAYRASRSPLDEEMTRG